MADGLPSNVVLALCQDSRGFLWIGTDEGLSVYDGSSFQNLSTADGLPWNRVSDIIESKKEPGTLWVATHGGGVARYRDNAFSVFRIDDDQAANTVDGIAEDHAGVIWFVSHGGIFRIANDSLSCVLASATMAGGDVAISSDSIVWAGVDYTLYAFSGDSIIEKRSLDLTPPNHITSMLAGSAGSLWVGTESGYLSRLDPNGTKNLQRVSHSGITCLHRNPEGEILVSVWDRGILSIDPEALSSVVSKYTTGNGLSENTITTMFLDREENLWLGGAVTGLLKLSEPSFYRIDLPGIHTHRSGFVDRFGHLWIAGGEGIWELIRKKEGWFKHLHTFPEFHGKSILVRQDLSGTLWVGFTTGTIAAFDIQQSRSHESQLLLRDRLEAGERVPAGTPLLLFVDSKERIWRSYQPDPLVVLENQGSYQVVKSFSSPDYPVNSLRISLEDRDGNLWFGSFSEGVSVLPRGDWRREAFVTITTSNGLPDNGIRSLFQDSTGAMWIGLRHGGIAVIGGSEVDPLTAVRRGDPFRIYDQSYGLNSNAVWDITQDDFGRLWCATSAGIQHVSQDSTVRFEGILELAGFSAGTVGNMGKGTVWALGRNSLFVYDFPPGARDTIRPPVYITQVTADGKAIHPDSNPELLPENNSLTIGFVGISLRQEKLVRYQYRLLGAEADWRSLDRTNRVTYAGLSPGSYRFEVRAISSKGAMSPRPAVFLFTILTPLYQRWWFIALAVVALMVLTSLLVWARAKHLLAIERIRSRIATDLHDDIGASLTRISVFSSAAQQELKQLHTGASQIPGDPGKLRSHLTDITLTSRDLTEAMSDVVWSVDPRNDSFDRLLMRMKTYAGRVLEARGLEYDIDIPDLIVSLELPLDFRRNFLLIFKETLNNAIRHSHASHIRLSVVAEGGSVVLTITDDGIGFEMAETRSGNGLTNLKKRADAIGGTLKIVSRTGEGTMVELRARIP